MKKPIWQFANNQFVNSTKKSYRKAMRLSKSHDSYLYKKTLDFPGDPDWTLLYNRYHIEHLLYMTAYSNWKASGGSLSGNTQTLKELVKLLPRMLDQWIAAIIPVYDKVSSKFKAYFPSGRTVFETGRVDDRITAVKTLSTTMGSDVLIAPAKMKVDSDYNLLNNARILQEGGKSSKKSLSQEVEESRIAVMGLQYGNMGF